METKTKLTIGAIITLMMAMGGTYYLADNDNAYYCEAKDTVMICEKLSSGLGTRCYFDETYKTCKEGWNKIEISQEITPSEIPIIAEGIKYLCSVDNCREII